MIDYGVAYWSVDPSNLRVYIGNMCYDFGPGPDSGSDAYDDYVLNHMYYGETIFCTTRETLGVLRDIRLGDHIEDALRSLPGNRTPQKWAIDQLYGEYRMPNSASLEYSTPGGGYELRIYCESVWIRLFFGNSGKLWLVDVEWI